MRCKNIILLLSVVLGCQYVLAQDPVVVGHKFTIESAVLGETREIQIRLPKNYHNSQFAQGKYPVFYVLDGEDNFEIMGALERYNTKFMYRSWPEMIVVAITSTQRYRDFTPTSIERSIKDHGLETQGGGAPQFEQFLEKELMPYVNEHYRTSGYNILWGHSLSGLYVMYNLLYHPQVFNTYIAVDPSLWWDKGVLAAPSKWKTTDFGHRQLFLSRAFHEAAEEHGMRTQRYTENFCAQFKSKAIDNPSLNVELAYYPDENHGGIPIPATRDAFKSLFGDMTLPVRLLPKHPELVAQTYAQLSEKLNFTFYPDESLLIHLIEYIQKQNEFVNAQKLKTYALEIYPDSKALKAL